MGNDICVGFETRSCIQTALRQILRSQIIWQLKVRMDQSPSQPGSPLINLDQCGSAPLEDLVEVGQVGDLDEGAVLGHGLGRVTQVPLGVPEYRVLNAATAGQGESVRQISSCTLQQHEQKEMKRQILLI